MGSYKRAGVLFRATLEAAAFRAALIPEADWPGRISCEGQWEADVSYSRKVPSQKLQLSHSAGNFTSSKTVRAP